jgi:hypothetical protein
MRKRIMLRGTVVLLVSLGLTAAGMLVSEPRADSPGEYHARDALVEDSVGIGSVATGRLDVDERMRSVQGTGRAAALVAPVFYDGFESGDIRGAIGGEWFAPASRRVVGSHPHSGTYSLIGRHPAREDLRDSSDEIRAHVFNGSHENWVEWYLWIPGNYAHRAQSRGGENNKYFLVSGRDDPFEWRTPPGNWAIWFEWERSENPGAISKTRVKYGVEGTRLFENPLGTHRSAPFRDVILESDRATWVHFCVYVKTATNQAAADGAFHLFKNGDTIITNYDMPLGGVDSSQVLSGLVLGGWANSGYDEQTDFYVDDVSVYTSDPGTCAY